MAAIDSTQLRRGVVFKDLGNVYLVLKYKHIKKGRGLANVRVKVRNIRSGATLEKTFTSNEKVESVDLSHRKAQYLYSDKYRSYFMKCDDYSQFSIENSKIDDQMEFLTEGLEIDTLWLEDDVVSIELPKKVKLTVRKTGPGIAGDTAGSATKDAELDTGYILKVPLFIKEGDEITINTESGEYVSRV